MSRFAELKRRNVIRVMTAYVVSAWVIVQVAETTFPIFGFSDIAIRNVIVVLMIGLVPAIALSWIFQFTPDGLRRDTGDSFAAPQKTRLLDRAIIVILLLGVSYFAFDKYVLAPEREAELEARVATETETRVRTGFYGDRSIAVLPFVNMSSDSEQEYFADGISEEVLNLLAHIRELRVISRSSAFAFKGQDLEIPDIAERLDVAHVLEGSVRKMGNTVRITAQLIEARSDTHLWSKTYTREFENAFQIQDEIAADVTRNLQIELLRELPRSRYIDPEVRSLTKQADQLTETRPENVGAKMYELLSRALEIDPDYVPALILMFDAHWYMRGEELITEEEETQAYEEIQAKVRKLDPYNGALDAGQAFDLAREDKLDEAAALYSNSLAKDATDSNNVRLAALFARRLGKLSVSLRLNEHAVAIDPLCHQCRARLAQSLMYVGDYERARLEQERYMTSGTGWKEIYVQILLLDNKPDEALKFLQSTENNDNNPHGHAKFLGLAAMTRYSLGEIDRADELLAELVADDLFDRRSLSFMVAETAAWMNQKELAFEKLFEIAPTNFTYLKHRIFSPVWQNLHDDPRWLEFLVANNTSPERLSAIEFDPELPE